MADLGYMLAALAALVIPLVMAYMLTGWCADTRQPRRPKAESGKKAPDTRQIQE
jgi:hypothetical protein